MIAIDEADLCKWIVSYRRKRGVVPQKQWKIVSCLDNSERRAPT